MSTIDIEYDSDDDQWSAFVVAAILNAMFDEHGVEELLFEIPGREQDILVQRIDADAESDE